MNTQTDLISYEDCRILTPTPLLLVRTVPAAYQGHLLLNAHCLRRPRRCLHSALSGLVSSSLQSDQHALSVALLQSMTAYPQPTNMSLTACPMQGTLLMYSLHNIHHIIIFYNLYYTTYAFVLIEHRWQLPNPSARCPKPETRLRCDPLRMTRMTLQTQM